MSGIVGKTAFYAGRVVDAPADALRYAAKKAWRAIPGSQSAAVQNFLDDTSSLTRGIVKAGAIGGGMYGAGLLAAGSALPLIPAVGAAAALGARATRFDPLDLGGPPSNPKEPLLETAQKLANFKTVQQAGILRGERPPARPVPPIAFPPARPLSPDAARHRRNTDLQMQTFIRNASISSTLFFIHYSRLGLEIDDALIPKIIEEASAPDASLWDVYMKYLGKDLSCLQWIRAGFWYFLSHTLGIIPNSIDTFATNVLKEARTKMNDRNQIYHLENGITKLLDHVSSFLDIYNNATRAYAEAKEPRGDVDFYRQEAIQKLGGKSLEELTKEFCVKLVDEFFPRIPFFETLKQYRFVGWFFHVLDCCIGGLINCIGRWLVKRNLPSVVQALVETGVNATHPSNLPFTIAITQAATKILQDLHDSPDIDTSEPPFKPAKLPTVIEKLMVTLALAGSKEQPLDSQKKLLDQFRKIESKGSIFLLGLDRYIDRTVQEEHKDALVKAGHALISYMVENTDNVFFQVLSLLNVPFESGNIYTQRDYHIAKGTLESTAEKTFKKLINEGLKGIPHAQQTTIFRTIYREQKTAAEAALQELHRCANALNGASTNQRLAEIDHYAQILKDLNTSAEAAEAGFGGDAGKHIKRAYYESFLSFYRKLPGLSQKIVDLQELLIQKNRNAEFSLHLEQAENAIAADRLHAPEALAHLKLLNTALQQNFASRFRINSLKSQIETLEQASRSLEVNQPTFLRLSRLLEINQRKFALDPKRTVEHIRKTLTGSERKSLDPLLMRLDEEPLSDELQIGALTEIGRLHELYRQEQERKTQTVQATVGHIQRDVAALRGEYTRMAQQTNNGTAQKISDLQRDTQSAQASLQAVEQASVNPSFWPELITQNTARFATWKWVMPFFKNAFNFSTTKNTYDAFSRIFMRSVLDTYK